MLVFTLLAVAALVSTASAIPQAMPRDITNSCNTGDMMCCNDISSVKQTSGYLDSLNFAYDVMPVFDFGHLGIECASGTGIGGGDSGGSCAAQPVCCENVDMNYLVGIGCSPINIVG